MGQPVAFFEVISPDHERAQKFYRELFGWQVTADPAMGGYGLVDTAAGDGAIGGGIGPSGEPGERGVKIYMRVDDLDAYLDRAEQLGGQRLAPPPTCLATTAASPSSPTRTATRSACGAELARPLISLLGQDGPHRVEDRRILDRGRYRLVLAVGYAPHGLAQDLA